MISFRRNHSREILIGQLRFHPANVKDNWKLATFSLDSISAHRQQKYYSYPVVHRTIVYTGGGSLALRLEAWNGFSSVSQENKLFFGSHSKRNRPAHVFSRTELEVLMRTSFFFPNKMWPTLGVTDQLSDPHLMAREMTTEFAHIFALPPKFLTKDTNIELLKKDYINILTITSQITCWRQSNQPTIPYIST